MTLKSPKQLKSSMLLTKEESADELDNYTEDFNESDSNEERNLLSDDSDVDQSDESLHSSDEEPSTTAMEHKLMENPAWADAMSKILKSNKPKRKKNIVLARAKKLNDTKKAVAPVEEKLSFEIIKNDQSEETEVKPEIKEEKHIESKKSDPIASLTVAQKRLLRKIWQSKGRVKPSVLEKDREKALSKIATKYEKHKGVITLFNAVRQQQKTLSEKLNEAGGLEVKRDKAFKSVNKKEFLETLAERAKCENVDNPVKSESDSDNDMPASKLLSQNAKTGKTWNVLRNNFMMGASMKDWDKEEDVDEKSKMKKKQKTSDKKESKTGSGGAKFSFSMDMDDDYDDNDVDGSEGEDDDGNGSSDFSD